MALTKKFPSAKSKNIRWNPDTSLREGCDRDQHLMIGTTASPPNSLRHRAMIEFDQDWAGVGKIVAATLYVRVDTQSTHYSFGTAPRVKVHRATEEWSAVTSSEDTWTAAMYQSISSFGGYADEKDVPIQHNYWLGLDVTRLMQYIAPTNVLMPDGNPGQGGTNNGFVLLAPGDENITKQRSIFKSRYNPTPADWPYIELVYDPPNRPPDAPYLIRPATTGSVGFESSFEGDHRDPDGDALAGRYINVYLAGTGTLVWTLPANLNQAGSEESQNGRFSVPLSLAQGSLKYGTAYEWTAATKDVHGRVGPHSARRLLTITSLAPNIGLIGWDEITDLSAAYFGGSYYDPEGNPINIYHIQMRSQSAHTDVAFSDQNELVWDTGETFATQQQKTEGGVHVPYAGQSLALGDYTYRWRAQNLSRQWSPWLYDDFSLVGTNEPTEPGQPGYPPEVPTDPLELDFTTQIDRRAPVRIALTKMGPARGPSAAPEDFIGFIDDPIELGASAYLNGGGELYFTLPALHPYCPEIEPHRVHYRVEQWYGDRYRALFFGVITDFDAGPDEVVFYGTDYLGLLQTAVDERFLGDSETIESEKPASGTGGGGSKYSDKSLDWIIRDQLLYHKGLTDSPVGFINVGPISALAEKATIYSTYTEALPFIMGLIDSHKQGTGREARFYPRTTNVNYTGWEWVLRDNWGLDRPNIRLEYGSLINDFRVVALGDFGTRVLGIGSKRGEVRVFRATGQSELSEAHFGRRSKVTYHADIIDSNDLTRRVKEQASQLAKVGKRIAMAIRADALIPFDGWDLGDSIVIDIVRGVVDTKLYGTQGLWTVYGVEYRYSPDGHTDLTLTLMPKKTLTAANPDLIPSINPGVGKEWQVGYGVPTTYGEPPSRTPTPLREDLPLSTEPVIALFYEDLNTGCVYELDEESGEYNEAYCPPSADDLIIPSDTTPPDPPTIKTLVTASNQQSDGTTLTAITATVGYPSPPGMDDLSGYTLEVTFRGLPADPTSPDWSSGTKWLGPAADRVGAIDVVINVIGILPATQYWVRASATDVNGNRSGWSGTQAIASAGDAVGPPLPTGVVAQVGHGTIGLRWTAINVLDLDYVEVQYREAPAGNWTSIRVAGTLTIITGLKNDAETPSGYEVRLRSVDTSGNVLRDTGGGVYETVKVVTDPNAGWVNVAPNPRPSALSGDSLVWSEAMFGNLFAGWINADWITAGTLHVGTQARGQANAISVFDATGAPIGSWSTNGIEVLSPSNGTYRMLIKDSSLTIWSGYGTANPIEAVRLSPLGIDAASVTFGTARGGHNLVINSSFELGRFATGTPQYHVWDNSTDWNNTRQGSDINVTTDSGSLRMTTI